MQYKAVGRWDNGTAKVNEACAAEIDEHCEVNLGGL